MPYETETYFPIKAVTINGPPPLGDIHLTLERGVTAIYGMNGVGKSRLISALKSALAGRGGGAEDPALSEAWVHCRIEPGDLESLGYADLTEQFWIPFTYWMAESLWRAVDDDSEEAEWGKRTIGTMLRSELTRLWMRQEASCPAPLVGLAERIPRLISEIVAQGYVSLKLNGHGWDVWVSGWPSDDSPEVRRWAESAIQLLTDPEIDDSVEWGAVGEIISAFAEWDYPNRASPVPLQRVTQADDPGGGFVVTLDEGDDVITRSSSLILQFVLGHYDKFYSQMVADAGTVEEREELEAGGLRSTVEAVLEVLADDATDHLRDVLGDHAPELSCEIASASNWSAGTVKWMARDKMSDTWLPISELGAGRSRWAVGAVRLALDRSEHIDNALCIIQ